MYAPLLRIVRVFLCVSTLFVVPLVGCSAQSLGDDEHEACELEPQTLAISQAPAASEGGEENIGTTSEELSVSCNMSSGTGYKSGNSFKIKLVTVDGKKVEWKTANAFYRMAKAAAKDGVKIAVVSGFRSNSEQAYLYNCYKCGCCNGGNLAAPPGYSNHQSGHALDLNTSSAGVYSWLSKHGGSYGFKRTVPSEAWHWEWWGEDKGQGPCNSLTLKAKLAKKSSNAKRFRGKKAHYVACAGDKVEMSFTFKNKGSAVWRDTKGRGNTMGSDVFLVTASGKKDKLTGKTRFSVTKNKNRKVRGDRKAKNCSSKNGCRKTTFVNGGIKFKAPKKTGIYKSRWRLRDYSKLHGKSSKGFGPKAELKFKVMSCETGACGCTVWCTDGSKHKVAADTSSAQCKSVGASMCEPAKYLSHHFEPCPQPGTGGSGGGTGGSGSGGTAGSGSTASSGGTAGSPSGSGGSGNETGGGDPAGTDPVDPDDDPAFPPDEEDPNAIDSGEDESATAGTEEADDENYGEEDGFDGDEEGLSRGGVEEASAGCSVARAGDAGRPAGAGLLALLALAGAWRLGRRGTRRAS
jgi:hypothetical protein